MNVVGELWSSMGLTGRVIVSVLALLSIYSYAVMVDRALALRWARARSAQFCSEVEKAGLTGDLEGLQAKAAQADKQGHCAVAHVVSAGLKAFRTLRAEEQPQAVIVEGVDEAVSRALDVAVINFGANSVAILINDAAGVFATAQTARSLLGARALIAGDWDADGSLDLAVANFSSNAVVNLRNNGAGSFSAVQTPIGGQLGVRGLAAGDWDADNTLDLASACSGDNSVKLLRNQP